MAAGIDTLRVVLEARSRLGEGPCWDAQAGRLYWVDIYNHRVHEFNPVTGSDRFFDVGETVGCLAPAGAGRLILGLRHHLAWLDTRTGGVNRFLEFETRSSVRCNDGKCDAQGRFWFGTMATTGPDASLYRYDPDGSLQVMESGLTVSNGLGWSPDGGTFYLTDSPAQVIYSYDFESDTGRIGKRRVLVDLRSEAFFPDGLTVDREGGIWSAMWDGWCVIRFDARGREIQRVPMPVQRPTCCAFGGPGLATLFITTAAVGLGEDEIERSFHSGDLFALDAAVTGVAANRFSG